MRDSNSDEKDWLEAFSSPTQIQAALREKTGNSKHLISRGEQVKNYPKPQRVLDLHGMTGTEAERSAKQFLNSAGQQGLRTVKLITGKGLHSKNGQSVLPSMIEDLLVQMRRSRKVLDFKWEQGGGAIVVYLH